MIGSDESLKGDTFGGIVVAAVYADDKQKIILQSFGVMDSKKVSDKKIYILAPKIRELCKHSVISLFPIEYNGHKQTKLLNELHQRTAKELEVHRPHIVDKYPGCTVGDIIETKAESKYIEVAAASILAREEALKQMDQLSIQLGFTAPKGSTHVQDALEKLKASGKDPKFFVKMHFKNVQKVFS